MSRYGIIFNVDRCIGCEACFVACKEENKVAPGIQWNKIRRIENVGKRVINYYRVSCQHCEDPACMKVCPAKAISTRSDLGSWSNRPKEVSKTTL